MVAIPSSPPASREVVRTAIVPVMLSGADYRRAHDAHHIAAGLWDQAVDWVHAEWKAKHNPSKYDIRAFLISIPREQRPLHAHTTEAIGYDLYEAIKTSRTNRKNGMSVRSPWRKKNYRPLSFSKHFGWRIRPDNKLNLSLGRGRPGIVLALPNVEDPVGAELVSPDLWSEIQLCWDQDNRQFSLHIPYTSRRSVSAGKAITAIDEGIINPMTLATWWSKSLSCKRALPFKRFFAATSLWCLREPFLVLESFLWSAPVALFRCLLIARASRPLMMVTSMVFSSTQVASAIGLMMPSSIAVTFSPVETERLDV